MRVSFRLFRALAARWFANLSALVCALSSCNWRRLYCKFDGPFVHSRFTHLHLNCATVICSCSCRQCDSAYKRRWRPQFLRRRRRCRCALWPWFGWRSFGRSFSGAVASVGYFACRVQSWSARLAVQWQLRKIKHGLEKYCTHSCENSARDAC